MARIQTKPKRIVKQKDLRKKKQAVKASSLKKSKVSSLKKSKISLLKKFNVSSPVKKPSKPKRRLPLSSVTAKPAIAASSAEYIPVPKPQLRKSVNVEDSSLPDLSDKTRLRLMARDPHWVHAYWKVAPKTLQEAQKDLGKSFQDAKYVLRVHDVTYVDFNGRNANRTFDIEVNPKTQNWYVDSWKDNVSYCAQLGLSTGQGEFYPLAESNFVQTPRLSFSDRGDLMWMDVKPGAQKLPFVLTGKSSLRKWSGKGRRYLTEDDIRAYYSKLFPLLRRIFGKRLKRYGKRKRLGGLEGMDADDDLLMNLHQNKWFRRILLGASEEMVETGEEGARAGIGIGASESLSSMAGASEQLAKKRKFFFELGTELIVYGRTEPDAQVWHGKKQIPLRSDGTFSMRFALPDDGFIPLDFKAISHDQIEMRTILTSGKRSKTKHQTQLF
jgi:hypothetical protein